jgi:TPP-dependent indolepyruvate ferredoxin oxidoreductase alpha subunit
MFTVEKVLHSGWFFASVVLRATADLEHTRQTLGHDRAGAPSLKREHLRIRKGEEFKVRLPRSKAQADRRLNISDVERSRAFSKLWSTVDKL